MRHFLSAFWVNEFLHKVKMYETTELDNIACKKQLEISTRTIGRVEPKLDMKTFTCVQTFNYEHLGNRARFL